jgi:hypothetical protein
MLKLTCMCSSYKRPELLANAVACFQAQTYPKDSCELVICDDAGQFQQGVIDRNIIVISIKERFPTLSQKFDYIAINGNFRPDVLVVFEDDDIYLPNHLQNIASAVQHGGQFIQHDKAYSNYNQNKQNIIMEPAAGRFHACWAYTRELYLHVGGYPSKNILRLDFDMQMQGVCKEKGIVGYSDHEETPFTGWSTQHRKELVSYVYRWGNPNSYHGSQAGEAGFQRLWDSLALLPCPFLGKLVPKFDNETQRVYQQLGFTV